MSVIPTQGDGKITVPTLLQRKSDPASQKIVCLTAYDSCSWAIRSAWSSSATTTRFL
jgi:hypothetical protein